MPNVHLLSDSWASNTLGRSPEYSRSGTNSRTCFADLSGCRLNLKDVMPAMSFPGILVSDMPQCWMSFFRVSYDHLGSCVFRSWHSDVARDGGSFLVDLLGCNYAGMSPSRAGELTAGVEKEDLGV